MKTRNRWTQWLSWPTLLLVALAWVGSLAALPFAPDRITTHWNLAGEPDGWMSRVPGLLGMPAMLTALALVFVLLPTVDPRRQNYAAFGSTYRLVQLAVLGLLTAVHFVTIAVALGVAINISMVILLLVGLLMLVLGNVMGKLRPNWFVGVRTPWTLSSPDVWTRTHRFMGRYMVIYGLVLLLSAVLLPNTLKMIVVVVGALGTAVLSFGYSYWLWRRLESSQEDDRG